MRTPIISSIRITAAAVCVLFLLACKPSDYGTATMRYEMVVSFTQGGKTYRGSAIQELRASIYPTMLQSESPLRVDWRGRGVLIPMGNQLFAALMETQNSGQFGDFVLRSCGLTGENILAKVASFSGSCTLERPLVPFMILTRGRGQKLADVASGADWGAIKVEITATDKPLEIETEGLNNLIETFIGPNRQYPLLTVVGGHPLGGPEFAKRDF